MKLDARAFRVPEGAKVRLSHWPTRVKPFYRSEAHYAELLADHVKRMRERQNLLYAHHRYALLVIFQALDAAGKDGAIKHVMSGVNPQGCQVYSFEHPSAQELEHDFLWRTSRALPARGHIGIFNRSYYEEVLIVRAHRDILDAEGLPGELLRDRDLWKHRFRSINSLERHLHDNGTRVIKFFLHISKEEQRKRLLARIDDPNKNWKFSRADVDERALWKEYQAAYEDCMAATSTKHAPWYVVPADDKENARLVVSRVILAALDGLELSFPRPSRAQLRDLKAIRRRLLK
jgi:PPK2 family polyphosphate:nucleotide phosphotransferase